MGIKRKMWEANGSWKRMKGKGTRNKRERKAATNEKDMKRISA